MGVLLLAPFLAVATQQVLFDPLKDVFRDHESAYALLPAEAVFGSNVTESAWSPDGRFLLAAVSRTIDPVAEMNGNLKEGKLPFDFATGGSEVVLHSLADRRSTTLWRSERGMVQSMVWVGRTGRAVVVFEEIVGKEGEATFLGVNSADGATNVLRRQKLSQTQSKRVVASPLLDLAIVHTIDVEPGGTSVAIFKPAGDVPISVPNDFNLGHIAWAQDGTPRLAVFKRSGENAWLQVGEDGSSREAAKFSPYMPRVFALSLQVGKGAATTEGVVRNLKSWWIHTNNETAQAGLLVGDATDASISPVGDAAFYVSGGAGFVRRIVKMPLDAYEQAMKDAAKRKAIQSAKMAGLAFLIYSADNADRLPGAKEFFDKVAPYFKDVSDLNGFVYLRDGESLADMKDPSEVALGYIQSGDGFAVSYCDGSVRWSDKPPG